MAEYRVADLAHPRATEQHVDCPECLALEPFAVGMAKAMGTVSHTYTERRDGEVHGITVTREPRTPGVVHYTPQGLIPPGHEHTDDMARVTCVPCIDGEPYQRALAAVAEEYGDPLPPVKGNLFGGRSTPEPLQVYQAPAADSDAAKIRAEVHRMAADEFERRLPMRLPRGGSGKASALGTSIALETYADTLAAVEADDDRCPACGQHVADPHAVGCPHRII